MSNLIINGICITVVAVVMIAFLRPDLYKEWVGKLGKTLCEFSGCDKDGCDKDDCPHKEKEVNTDEPSES